MEHNWFGYCLKTYSHRVFGKFVPDIEAARDTARLYFTNEKYHALFCVYKKLAETIGLVKCEQLHFAIVGVSVCIDVEERKVDIDHSRNKHMKKFEPFTIPISEKIDNVVYACAFAIK